MKKIHAFSFLFFTLSFLITACHCKKNASKDAAATAEVKRDFEKEGYVGKTYLEGEGPLRQLVIVLKYFENKPVIEQLSRVSRPGLRIYKNKADLPKVKNGLGIAVISTSKGVMSSREARRIGEGGEVICIVS